jgi:hypothetical protein
MMIKDEDLEKKSSMLCCASCGATEENDDIKLMTCNACQLVRYCGVECQRKHRQQHKRECKKRAAELHDEILFKQPESSHHGDCPICLVPLSLDTTKSAVLVCCSKVACLGCAFGTKTREHEESLDPTCPFCRQSTEITKEEADLRRMRRAEANDPVALRELGFRRYRKEEYISAFEYWTKAAELGDTEAHYQLSCLYQKGEGVEMNKKKELYHLEKAAIGGHPIARYNLGCVEMENCRIERAVKHYIIASNLGYDDSLKRLGQCYAMEFVQKEDYAAALRAHQAAVDATKSPQREAAEAEFAN